MMKYIACGVCVCVCIRVYFTWNEACRFRKSTDPLQKEAGKWKINEGFLFESTDLWQNTVRQGKKIVFFLSKFFSNFLNYIHRHFFVLKSIFDDILSNVKDQRSTRYSSNGRKNSKKKFSKWNFKNEKKVNWGKNAFLCWAAIFRIISLNQIHFPFPILFLLRLRIIFESTPPNMHECVMLYFRNLIDFPRLFSLCNVFHRIIQISVKI